MPSFLLVLTVLGHSSAKAKPTFASDLLVPAALHMASANGFNDVVKALIGAGAVSRLYLLSSHVCCTFTHLKFFCAFVVSKNVPLLAGRKYNQRRGEYTAALGRLQRAMRRNAAVDNARCKRVSAEQVCHDSYAALSCMHLHCLCILPRSVLKWVYSFYEREQCWRTCL